MSLLNKNKKVKQYIKNILKKQSIITLGF